MIVCLTPNPAIDRTATVRRLAYGTILRPTTVVAMPGGKGNNVARAAHRLGALVSTTGFAGGHGGRWMVEALEREGLNPRFVTVAGETRTTYVTVDGGGRSVLVYEPGSAVTPAEVEELVARLVDDLLPAATWVAISGSLPDGMDPGTIARLVTACRSAGRPCIVDTGGAALAEALPAGPDIVKVSRDEAADAIGRPSPDAPTAARALAALGARLAVVTDGPRGAGASDGRSGWVADAPRIHAIDEIGSGDVFAAAFIVALEAGRTVDDALAAAVGAAAANAETIGAGRFEPERAIALAAQVDVRPVRG